MRSLQTTKRWRNWFGNLMPEAQCRPWRTGRFRQLGTQRLTVASYVCNQLLRYRIHGPRRSPLRYGALRVRGSPCQSAPGRHDYGLRNNNQQDGSRSETSLRPDGRSEICSSRRRLCRQRRPVQEILSRGERCGQDSAGGCLHSRLPSASGSILLRHDAIAA